MADHRQDKELQQYRELLEQPKGFKEGFGWSTVVGIFFCGLVMLPGSIYLGLMSGIGMGPAATWVTVILFMEISRRALKTMQKEELVVLLHAATIMMVGHVMFPGGPFGQIIYRAFFIGCDAVRDAGMSNSFPTWFVPGPDSDAILERNLMHKDWLIPVALLVFIQVISKIKQYTLGYAFFRITSDIEKLPFPLAPISAQGAMALSEADGEQDAKSDKKETSSDALKKNQKKKKSPKWRLFSLAASIGIIFGFFQVGIPSITSILLDKPVFLIPQPFLDTTTLTEAILPATPTGFVIDLGVLFLGFVLPFWSVMGAFAAIIITLIANPMLHHFGVLTSWQPGMETVNTTFANNLDFWLSFGVGSALGISLVSIYAMVRDITKQSRLKKQKRLENPENKEDVWSVPQGRGDYPLWIAFVIYSVAGLAMIWVCNICVPQLPLAFLFIFVFLYNPFISYVSARLLGISGQSIDIPFIKETAFVLSGAKGLELWLAPIPIENFGGLAQSFRVNELTGVRFFSMIKADLVAFPVILVLSFAFWAFIWKADAVPSDMFPSAQIQWELMAKNQALIFSSTFEVPGDEGGSLNFFDTELGQAIKYKIIATGGLFTVIGFSLLSFFNLPVMLIYGFLRGMGQLPHYMVLEVVGAFIGRFYFRKKIGVTEFLKMAPILMAGYYTGVGLIGMATIALKLISKAVSGTPF